MVVLKRITASTLMETLVATILIVVVFMLSSMLLNSLFANAVTENDKTIKQELLLLQYQYEYDRLPLPYYDEQGPWQIEVHQESWNSQTKTVFVAVHSTSQKEILYTISNE